MIKTIIFAALLALSLADFTPTWKDCGSSTDSWHPTSFTLSNPPGDAPVDTATICGNSTDTFTLNEYDFVVKVLTVVVYSGSAEVPAQQIIQQNQCWQPINITIVPFLKGAVAVQFKPLDSTGQERGCVEVDVTIS